MKRILSISILLFLFACEEDKADETANEMLIIHSMGHINSPRMIGMIVVMVLWIFNI